MSETTMQHIWQPETGITGLGPSSVEVAASEMGSIKRIWAEQKERLKGTSLLSKFTERLSREWAIETGVIENLYQIDRGITQTLIERGFHAEFLTHGSTNKPPGYVINLLRDQQDALEGVFAFIKQNRPLTTSYIKQLHSSLVQSQDCTEGIDAEGRLIEIPLIKGDWKIHPNYPTRDGVTFGYCPPEQVASEMDRLVAMHQEHLDAGVPAEVEAAWLHHRFSQIHPFQDGNGRVCRALASMVLVQAGLFPLVVTRNEKDKYIDALEAADKGDLKWLVDLFVSLQLTQFRKATALSENILTEGENVASALSGLKKAAERSKEARQLELQRVFDLSRQLEDDTVTAFEELVPELQKVLLSLSHRGAAFVKRSNQSTNHFYWGQIVENAREHLDYFADTSSYRSWVTLNMVWERRARLVFTFHGIGRPFSGSLVCAPFFEFRDGDDNEQTHSTIVPIAESAFVFFHDETQEAVADRFRSWRDKVVTVALKQLGESL
ncbi:MAG: Fic family protein [Verrucomicrobiae bacterium]|nr:Fic family protein [Verrucomicrobiae bacterium]